MMNRLDTVYTVKDLFKVIQTNQPSRLIYHISCRIDYAYDAAGIIAIVNKSEYNNIRIQKVK